MANPLDMCHERATRQKPSEPPRVIWRGGRMCALLEVNGSGSTCLRSHYYYIYYFIRKYTFRICLLLFSLWLIPWNYGQRRVINVAANYETNNNEEESSPAGFSDWHPPTNTLFRLSTGKKFNHLLLLRFAINPYGRL